MNSTPFGDMATLAGVGAGFKPALQSWEMTLHIPKHLVRGSTRGGPATRFIQDPMALSVAREVAGRQWTLAPIRPEPASIQ